MLPGPALPEPGRPAQLSVTPENHRRNFVVFEHEAEIPIELETEIESNPVHEFSDRGSARQKAFVLVERERPKLHAKLVLAIPDGSARDRAAAEHGTFPAEIRPFARAE